MSPSEIRAYLRAPASPQQRLNALGVHSLATIQDEREAESVASVRAQYGYLDVPIGSGHDLV